MQEQAYGRYFLLRKIAVGGMGELFLAKRVGPEGFERLVVIKRILPQFCSDARFVSVFLNEARLAAQLRHPHITQIFDLGKIEGAFFICMEYVEGLNLREFIQAAGRRETPLPIAAAVRIVSGVFSALEYAHERAEAGGQPLSVVHQDVSPPNILLSREGEVKLTDFGLARAALWGQQTTMGILRGKFPYMAPEHVAGRPQDKRSDLYAAGVILYELLTGVTPFQETGSPLKLLTDIQSQPPPDPRTLRSDVPEDLARLLERLLAKDPDHRPGGAHEVLEHLGASPAGQGFSDLDLARMVREVAPVSCHEKDRTEATHRAPSPLKKGLGAGGGSEGPGSAGRWAPLARFVRPGLPVLFLAILALGGAWLLGPLMLDALRGGGGSLADSPAAGTGFVPGSTSGTGQVHVSSNPPGASVFVDEAELAGATPLDLAAREPGSAHSVRVEKAGYRPWARRIEIPREGAPAASLHAELTPLPASLTVEFGPSPAELAWDGETRNVSSPFTLEGIDAASPHRLRLAAPGHLTEEQRIVLEPGQHREIRVRMEPMPPTADVRSQPAGAELWIDGKPTGRQTPLGSISLPADRKAVLRLTKEGYEPWTMQVAPRPGSREIIDARLKPLTGELRLDSTPWTDVYMNGKLLGRTPLLAGEVPAGESEILLVNRERGVEHRQTLRIGAGETVRKRFVFKGTLDLSGVPAGVDVLIGDQPAGRAPLGLVSLPVGAYEITLRDPGTRTEKRLVVRVAKDVVTHIKSDTTEDAGGD